MACFQAQTIRTDFPPWGLVIREPQRVYNRAETETPEGIKLFSLMSSRAMSLLKRQKKPHHQHKVQCHGKTSLHK